MKRKGRKPPALPLTAFSPNPPAGIFRAAGTLRV